MPPRPPPNPLRRLVQATRSGFRRYPRAIWESARGVLHLDRHHDGHDLSHDAWGRAELAAVWLGHGSILVRHGGRTILVDPVFSSRIGMELAGRTLGLPRLAPLPIDPAALPAIDTILITHAHFDHLDVPTLRRLASPRTRVITARRTAGLIPRGFGEVEELDWGKAARLEGLHVSAVRPRHWGARTALDHRRGYNSYVLRDGDGRGVLLAGDTAMTDAFDRLRDLELAVLGVGAYEPWANAHATPEEAWAMFRSCGARRLLPVHHSTFELGDEPIGEPMARLLDAARGEAGMVVDPVPGRVWAA